MTNTYITINEKCPRGLIELYFDVDTEAQKLAIPYMIVGTMARDLVLVHGFDAKIERGTRDVDFGICVESWEQFHSLATNLITVGFIQDEQVSHRFHRSCCDGLPWEIELIAVKNIFGHSQIDYGRFLVSHRHPSNHHYLGYEHPPNHPYRHRYLGY